jgi:hypothetical protein
VILGKLLQFARRHSKSRYADDKAVDDFACVAEDQGLPLDYDGDKRLVELLGGDDDPAGNLEEIANHWGSPSPRIPPDRA